MLQMAAPASITNEVLRCEHMHSCSCCSPTAGDATWQHLLHNNRTWAAAKTAADPAFFNRLTAQQSPQFLWIGCADSRVPANQIIGLEPGEVFVQRNVGNQASHTDLNCMACLEYAVQELKVSSVIVCGHYGCGAVRAALRLPSKTPGLVNCWISDIRHCRDLHHEQLMALSQQDQVDRLCELNVLRQAFHVCTSPVVQGAWERGQDVAVYGIIYSLKDGKIKRLAGPLTRQQSAVLSSHDLATAMAALGPSAQDSDSVREDSIEDTCSSEGGACSGQEAASGDVGGSGHVATVSAAAPAAAGGSGLDCTSSSVQHAPHPDAQYACDETADISLRNGTKDTSHQQHLPVLEQQQHPIHAAFVAGHAVAVKRVTSSCILAGLVAGRPRAHTEDGAAEAFGIAGLKVMRSKGSFTFTFPRPSSASPASSSSGMALSSPSASGVERGGTDAWDGTPDWPEVQLRALSMQAMQGALATAAGADSRCSTDRDDGRRATVTISPRASSPSGRPPTGSHSTHQLTSQHVSCETIPVRATVVSAGSPADGVAEAAGVQSGQMAVRPEGQTKGQEELEVGRRWEGSRGGQVSEEMANTLEMAALVAKHVAWGHGHAGASH